MALSQEDIWRSRLEESTGLTKFFWTVVYWLGRLFSFFLWNPLEPSAGQTADTVAPIPVNLQNDLQTVPNNKPLFAPLKQALVIGASPDECSKKERWGTYFSQMLCMGLPENHRIETGLDVFKDKSVTDLISTPVNLLKLMLNSYYENYKNYMTQHFEGKIFNTIIFDRAMQGLVIYNPRLNMELLSLKERGQFYGLMTKNLLENMDGKPGLFNQHVFFTLCFNLLSTLKRGGNFIVDTQFLNETDVALLSEMFHHKRVWDYTSEANQQLSYDECYKCNNHGEPKFIEFYGYKGQSKSFNIYLERIEASFSLEDAEAYATTPIVR